MALKSIELVLQLAKQHLRPQTSADPGKRPIHSEGTWNWQHMVTQYHDGHPT